MAGIIANTNIVANPRVIVAVILGYFWPYFQGW